MIVELKKHRKIGNKIDDRSFDFSKKIMLIKNKIVVIIKEDKIVEKSNCNNILQKL
jgi:hypothetical protein